MTIRHIKIFSAVCECGSITAAADKLYIAQPSISLAIRELEDYCGVKLFDRISKKLYLTEAGKNMLEHVSNILALFDEIEHIKDNKTSGTIKVGSSITVGTHYLPSRIKQFQGDYPDCEIIVMVNSSDVIEEMLLKNELDCAVIEGFTHSKYLSNESLNNRDNLCIVCSPEHRFAEKEIEDVREIYGEKFLLREKGSGTRELFDNITASLGYNIIPSWESTSTKVLINAVAANIGISIIPYKLAEDDILSGKLSLIRNKEIDSKLTRQFILVYHKNKYQTHLMKEFFKVVRNMFEV